MSGITGGTTRRVMRMAKPASQSRQKKRSVPANVSAALVPAGGMGEAGFQSDGLYYRAPHARKPSGRPRPRITGLQRPWNKDRTDAAGAIVVPPTTTEMSDLAAAQDRLRTIFVFGAFRPGQ